MTRIVGREKAPARVDESGVVRAGFVWWVDRGFDVRVEYPLGEGFVDLVITGKPGVVLVECKASGGTAEILTALRQLHWYKKAAEDDKLAGLVVGCMVAMGRELDSVERRMLAASGVGHAAFASGEGRPPVQEVVPHPAFATTPEFELLGL